MIILSHDIDTELQKAIAMLDSLATVHRDHVARNALIAQLLSTIEGPREGYVRKDIVEIIVQRAWLAGWRAKEASLP